MVHLYQKCSFMFYVFRLNSSSSISFYFVFSGIQPCVILTSIEKRIWKIWTPALPKFSSSSLVPVWQSTFRGFLKPQLLMKTFHLKVRKGTIQVLTFPWILKTFHTHLRWHHSELTPITLGEIKQDFCEFYNKHMIKFYIRFYINGTRIFLTCGLPLLSLVILNYKIHRGIR